MIDHDPMVCVGDSTAPLIQRTLGMVTGAIAVRDGKGYRMMAGVGRLAEQLAKRWDQVFLCAPVYRPGQHADADLAADHPIRADNITIVEAPAYTTMREALREWAGIVSAYREVMKKSDIVYVRVPLPLSFALLLHKGPLCVHVVSDLVEFAKNAKTSSPLWRSALYAYALMEESWQRRLAAKGGAILNGAQLTARYPGVPTTVVVTSHIRQEDLHERADTCTSPPYRLLFVGWFSARKGLDTLLQAMALLVRDGIDVRLDVVGGSMHANLSVEDLQRQALELGVAERLGCHGHQAFGPALFAHYRRADIFVLPSRSEGTPRVLVEARAFSLPVVATRVGGIPTSVEHGRNGLLVEPDRPEELAQAIARVIKDDRLRRHLIREGFVFAGRNTLEAHAAEVHDALRTAWEGSARSATN